MKTPEGYEKDSIKKYLITTRSFFILPYMMGYGKSGVSDIIGCMPRIITPAMVGQIAGFFYGVEVKREGKEPTPIQVNRIAEITMAGGIAFAGTADKVIPDIKRWVAKL